MKTSLIFSVATTEKRTMTSGESDISHVSSSSEEEDYDDDESDNYFGNNS